MERETGDRTGDIQLGKLRSTLRLKQNQAHRAGHLRHKGALPALIEHDSEHSFSLSHSAPKNLRLLGVW